MKKTIIIVLILYFFQGFIHNLGHPITPDFVGDLGIEDYMFGVFFALMSFGLVVGGPVWGILGDRGNKRVYMLLGLLIYSIGQFTFGNVHNIYVMIIARFVSGFGVSASVTLLMSYLIEVSNQEHKTRNIAFGTAAMALGASVGYLAGGYLPSLLQWFNPIVSESGNGVYTIRAEQIFLIQALLNTIFAFVLFSLVINHNEKVIHTSKPSFIQGFKDIRKMGMNLNVFLISLTFVSIGAMNISKYTEVYISDLGYGADGIGVFVFATGIIGILATVTIVPIIIRFKNNVVVMIVINILRAIIVLVVFRTGNIMLSLYTLFMLYVVLKAVYAPLETSFISSFAKDGEYGKVMGVRQSFFAIGFVIGPLVGGILYDVRPLLAFDFSVLMFIIAAILVLLVRNNIKKELMNKQNLDLE